MPVTLHFVSLVLQQLILLKLQESSFWFLLIAGQIPNLTHSRG